MFWLKRFWWRFNYTITHLGEFARISFSGLLNLFDQTWRTALGRRMIYALPALLMAAGIVILTMIYLQSTRPKLSKHYAEITQESLEQKNYDIALTASRRLGTLNGDSAETRYWRSEAYRGQGDERRADLLLASAASLDDDVEKGDANAHIAVGRRMYLAKNATPQSIRQAEQHLVRAAKLAPKSIYAQAKLGEYYFLTKQYDKAVPPLEIVAKAEPGIYYRLMQIAETLDRESDLRRYAKQTENFLDKALKVDPNNNLAREQLGETLMQTDRYNEAMQCYAAGLELAKKPEILNTYRRLMGNAYGRWATYLDGDLAKQMGLLEAGLKIDPANRTLIEKLGLLAQGDADTSKVAMKKLRELLADGVAVSQINFLLGIDAAQRGDYKVSQLHLEAALKLNPKLPNIANNLAWVMAQRDDADHKYALELAKLAVKSDPKQARFLDTRGQCYLRLGEYKLARNDLLQAVSELKDDPTIHAALATVYQKLGDPEMAKVHRLRVKSIQSAAATNR